MKMASRCKVKKTCAVQLQSRMKGYLDTVQLLVLAETVTYIRAPAGEPNNLVHALDGHPKLPPAQWPLAVQEQLLERQRQGRASDHGTVDEPQLPDLLLEQVPLPDLEGVARLLDLAQHGGNDHDGQADPEQHKEAAEVAVVARGVEVGDAVHVLDSREHAPLLLGAYLAARGGGGLDRGRGVGGDGRRSPAAPRQHALDVWRALALTNLETPEPASKCCLTASSLSWGLRRSMRVGLRGRGE